MATPVHPPGTILRSPWAENEKLDWIILPKHRCRRWGSTRSADADCIGHARRDWDVVGRLPPDQLHTATEWRDEFQLPEEYDPEDHDLVWDGRWEALYPRTTEDPWLPKTVEPARCRMRRPDYDPSTQRLVWDPEAAGWKAVDWEPAKSDPDTQLASDLTTAGECPPRTSTFKPSPDATPVPSIQCQSATIHGADFEFVTAQRGSTHWNGSLQDVLPAVFKFTWAGWTFTPDATGWWARKGDKREIRHGSLPAMLDHVAEEDKRPWKVALEGARNEHAKAQSSLNEYRKQLETAHATREAAEKRCRVLENDRDVWRNCAIAAEKRCKKLKAAHLPDPKETRATPPADLPPSTVFRFKGFPDDYGLKPSYPKDKFVMGDKGLAAYKPYRHAPDAYVWSVKDCDVEILSQPSKKGAPRMFSPLKYLKFFPSASAWLLVGWLVFGSGSQTVTDWWTAPTPLNLGDWTLVQSCDSCREVAPGGATICPSCGGGEFTEKKAQTLWEDTWTYSDREDQRENVRGHVFADGSVVLDPGNWKVPERVVSQEAE